MDALTLAELKRLCEQRGLAVGGTKGDLIERLTTSSKVRALGGKNQTNANKSGQETKNSSLFPSNYDALTLPQLKDLCRKRTLPVGGIKDAIVGRLKASDPRNMTLVLLKDRCREAGLPVTGTKSDLTDRVMKSLDGSVGTVDTKDVKVKSNAPVATQRPPPKPKTPPASAPNPPKPKPPTAKPMKPPSQLSKPQAIGAANKKATTVPPHQVAAGKKRKVVDGDVFKTGHAKTTKTSTKLTASARPIQQDHAKKTPAATQRVAAKSTPLARSSTPLPSSSEGCYLVYTIDNSEATDPVGVFSTKAAANARVRQEFYEMHPEGWLDDDFARHADAVRADYNDELLKLSLQAPHKPWGVTARWVPTNDQAVTTMHECYLVYSLQSMLGRNKNRRVKFYHLFTTKEAANALAKQVFYDYCAWNWTPEQFNDGRKPWVSELEGMASFHKAGNNLESWQVEVMPVEGGDATPIQKWFVVHSTRAFRQARHGPHREPIYEFYPPVKSTEEANTLAEKVFYRENSWAWTKPTFAGKPVQKKYHKGRLLEMSVRDNDRWTVRVVCVPEESPISCTTPGFGIVVYGLRGRENQVRPKSLEPDIEIERILASANAIDAHVEEIFYKRNPYGWKRAEFHEDSMHYAWSRPKIKKGVENNFPKWSITPSSDQSWSVRCKVFNLKPLKAEISSSPRGLSLTTLPATTGGSTAIVDRTAHTQSLKSEVTSSSKSAQRKREVKGAPSIEWFLVFSKNARFPRFGPNYQFFPLFKTKDEANDMVKHVYYKENPWGWTREDFRDNGYTTSKQKDGLLSLSTHEEEEWTVKAIRIPSNFRVPANADPASAIVIYSQFGYLPDGFHSAQEQEWKIQAVVTSKEAAATRVKQIFNENHSYAWSIAELTASEDDDGFGESRAQVEQKTRRGLLNMSLHPDSEESWSVHAQAVEAIGRDEKGAIFLYESEYDGASTDSDEEAFRRLDF